MSPIEAFYATSENKKNSPGTVNYTNNLVNPGNAWSLKTNTFTAPRSGTYVFSTYVLWKSG